jgi:hypothetical protein
MAALRGNPPRLAQNYVGMIGRGKAYGKTDAF